MKVEPRNEQKICETVMRFIGDRIGETLQILCRPEADDRTKEAVEIVAISESGKWAIEHTRIESFPRQIEVQRRYRDLSKQLEDRLDGRMPPPGRFQLLIKPDALTGIKKSRVPKIAGKMEQWILEVAPHLKIDDLRPGRLDPATLRKAVLPGIPFEVTLQRLPFKKQGHFICAFWSPENLEELRKLRIQKALNDKCPKLNKARAEGCRSVLILESNDISLANFHLIAQAIVLALQSRDDIPDHIYLFETEIEPWTIWVLKRDGEMFPAVSDPGPHEVGPVTA